MDETELEEYRETAEPFVGPLEEQISCWSRGPLRPKPVP